MAEMQVGGGEGGPSPDRICPVVVPITVIGGTAIFDTDYTILTLTPTNVATYLYLRSDGGGGDGGGQPPADSDGDGLSDEEEEPWHLSGISRLRW